MLDRELSPLHSRISAPDGASPALSGRFPTLNSGSPQIDGQFPTFDGGISVLHGEIPAVDAEISMLHNGAPALHTRSAALHKIVTRHLSLATRHFFACINSTISADVRTGTISKSIRSFQLSIHS